MSTHAATNASRSRAAAGAAWARSAVQRPHQPARYPTHVVRFVTCLSFRFFVLCSLRSCSLRQSIFLFRLYLYSVRCQPRLSVVCQRLQLCVVRGHTRLHERHKHRLLTHHRHLHVWYAVFVPRGRYGYVRINTCLRAESFGPRFDGGSFVGGMYLVTGLAIAGGFLYFYLQRRKAAAAAAPPATATTDYHIVDEHPSDGVLASAPLLGHPVLSDTERTPELQAVRRSSRSLSTAT